MQPPAMQMHGRPAGAADPVVLIRVRKGVRMDPIAERQAALAQLRRERYAWAKKVDPQAVVEFERQSARRTKRSK